MNPTSRPKVTVNRSAEARGDGDLTFNQLHTVLGEFSAAGVPGDAVLTVTTHTTGGYWETGRWKTGREWTVKVSW